MNTKLCDRTVLLFLGALLAHTCDAWFLPWQSDALGHPMPLKQRCGMQTNICRRSPPKGIRMIGTGFSFEDGEQILVSVQKPFGIVLEQGVDDAVEDDRIVVTEVDRNGSAGKAGVREGDVLVAVQNASTISADLSEVLDFIANRCPRVVNLRFQRPS